MNFTSNHHISQKLGIIATFQNRIDNLITDEEDKKIEEKRVEKKLKNCGYPNWAFKKRKKKHRNEEEMPVITLPYVKTISEKIARIYKKYGVKVVHKPSTTIKSTICKMKDPVHKMEKPGVNYQINCTKHTKDSYIGETERTMKFRGYEHSVIEHKELLKNMSLSEKEKEKTTMIEVATQEPTRRSARTKYKNKIDYKTMHEGERLPPINENSEVAVHMRENEHRREDMEIKILGYEQNWWKRGVKEAIHIRKLKPTLNKDQGRYNLSHIWTSLVEEEKEKETAEKQRNLIGRNLQN